MESKRFVAVWQTGKCPLAFGDFVNFLAISNCMSQARRCNGYFKFVVVNNGYRDVGVEAFYSESHQERKFRNVIVNSALMCNWVKDVEVIRDGTLKVGAEDILFPSLEERKKFPKDIPEWAVTPMTAKQLEVCYEKGLQNTKYGFSASKDAVVDYKKKFSKDSIILQLRQSIHTNARNFPSNIFSDLTKHLIENNIDVYFIPDIENPSGQDFLVELGAIPLIEATADYKVRLACSEAALCNVIWNGGVHAPLQFSPANCIYFGIFNPDVIVSNKDFFARKGPSFNRQPPWMQSNNKHLDWCSTREINANYLIERVEKFIVHCKK